MLVWKVGYLIGVIHLLRSGILRSSPDWLEEARSRTASSLITEQFVNNSKLVYLQRILI